MSPFGGYTAVVSGTNGSAGIALAECYDADAALGNASNTTRLINMSGRAAASGRGTSRATITPDGR